MIKKLLVVFAFLIMAFTVTVICCAKVAADRSNKYDNKD